MLDLTTFEVQVHFKNGAKFECKKRHPISDIGFFEYSPSDIDFWIDRSNPSVDQCLIIDDTGRHMFFNMEDVLAIIAIPPAPEPEEEKTDAPSEEQK